MTAVAVAAPGGRTGLPRRLAERTCWLRESHGLRRFIDLGLFRRCDLSSHPGQRQPASPLPLHVSCVRCICVCSYRR
ncbi:hypothetical protein FHX44_114920 [Pseudonocardia hierapolitana]|uniref:Uncharacterized protein n=1 Tax=Pseudonocardia hierapolitana TaxID=1128676 RepID=A0A561SVV4_9PSEU|nr:hypothetical protein FHX44_114920 [Pseudonocardia hierapolitana]